MCQQNHVIFRYDQYHLKWYQWCARRYLTLEELKTLRPSTMTSNLLNSVSFKATKRNLPVKFTELCYLHTRCQRQCFSNRANTTTTNLFIRDHIDSSGYIIKRLFFLLPSLPLRSDLLTHLSHRHQIINVR